VEAARILVVDDDAQIVALLRRYLVRAGFDIDTALSAEEALQLVRTATQPYSLVITDLSLPSMNGERMVEEMRRIQPGLPALISSGYLHTPTTPRTGFLQKPYLPKQLQDTVKALLAIP
jgi:DNA-binding NtrC family response regulator